jgi:hypothetical protein
MDSKINAAENSQQTFVEVLSETDTKESDKGQWQDTLTTLQQKANYSENMESRSAVKAALQYIEDEKSKAHHNSLLSQSEKNQIEDKKKTNWGIYTYFYNDKKCDYEKSTDLQDGQTIYRDRADQDIAKIFVSNGEVNRFKGD